MLGAMYEWLTDGLDDIERARLDALLGDEQAQEAVAETNLDIVREAGGDIG